MPKKNEAEIIRNHPNVKGRVMPHSEEAEKGLLCCFLIDEKVTVECISAFKPDDFYFKSHQKIFTAMDTVYRKGQRIDLVSVTEELDTMGELTMCGGVEYIITLTNYQVSSANYKHYFKIVKKDSLLRSLSTAAAEISELCYSGDADDKALVFAEQAITAVSERNGITALTPFSEAAAIAIDEMSETMINPFSNRGLQTGFKGLNKILSGLSGGDLIIIAARPGQGKTSIGMNIIQQVATAHIEGESSAPHRDRPAVCAVFSLEMPKEQLAKRMLCSMAKVSLADVKQGNMKDADGWGRLSKANAAISHSKIFVDDKANTTPAEILSKCRRLLREQGHLDLILVDYLTLMTSGKRNIENRQQDVSEISRQMKLAAKELKVPILLLSQLSRESEKAGRRPQMSDLRESGAIEQDADIICFIYRPKSDGNADPNANKAEFIIAKNRNGEQGTVHLIWDGPSVSFKDDDSINGEEGKESLVGQNS